MTTTGTTSATQRDCPDWCCTPIQCTVGEPSENGFRLGDHVQVYSKTRTEYGAEHAVGVVREHHATNILVQVTVRNLDDDYLCDIQCFEPEEARLLARRLIEAADEVEALRLN